MDIEKYGKLIEWERVAIFKSQNWDNKKTGKGAFSYIRPEILYPKMKKLATELGFFINETSEFIVAEKNVFRIVVFELRSTIDNSILVSSKEGLATELAANGEKNGKMISHMGQNGGITITYTRRYCLYKFANVFGEENDPDDFVVENEPKPETKMCDKHPGRISIVKGKKSGKEMCRECYDLAVLENEKEIEKMKEKEEEQKKGTMTLDD